MSNMIIETSFITNLPDPVHLLKAEVLDRLYSVVETLPKYKQNLDALVVRFNVDEMLYLINTIYRDADFKTSVYYSVYNDYFDEIEELIYKTFQQWKNSRFICRFICWFNGRFNGRFICFFFCEPRLVLSLISG